MNGFFICCDCIDLECPLKGCETFGGVDGVGLIIQGCSHVTRKEI